MWNTTKPNTSTSLSTGGQPRRKLALSNAEGLDVTKAKQQFGFRSRVDFEAGLRQTIEWYRASTTSLKQPPAQKIAV